ncbi:hypothetical protein NKH18_01475 [Streptomyces sp. M10(2022)]
MDGENATVGRSPRSHPDVATSVETFARHAKDQYTDAVVLLAALSSKLRSAKNIYADYDDAARQQLDAVLVCGEYVAARER